MIVEFLEVAFSRHGTCKFLCDISLALARSSPTRRYTGIIIQQFDNPNRKYLHVKKVKLRQHQIINCTMSIMVRAHYEITSVFGLMSVFCVSNK